MTDDDELIERLRRTLQTEATAITPSPEGHSRPPYPAPVLLRQPRMGRPRWPLALVAAAAVAAAVLVAALNWPSGGPSRIGIVAPSPPAPTAPANTSPANTAPALTPTTVLSTPTTQLSTTTVPLPPPTPVPAGFEPVAVTFVSASEGWAAGTVPCGSASCLSLARTFDGGIRWQGAPAPQVAFSAGFAAAKVSVRFADPADGWIYTLGGSTTPGLWSTHNGGATWTFLDNSVLVGGAAVEGLEASGGRVQAAILRGGFVQVMSSPITGDTWTASSAALAIGGGSVPATQVVLQKSTGWLIQNNRTVVGGLRLDSAGEWSAWTPPCAKANGTGMLGASNATDLVALCEEGAWGSPSNLPAGSSYPSQWIFQSSDGGVTFQATGPLPSTFAAQQLATSSPSTVILGGTSNSANVCQLSASFDNGHSWQTVYQGAPSSTCLYVGFTTLTQGVAVVSDDSLGASVLLMTHDGGHSWAPAAFNAG